MGSGLEWRRPISHDVELLIERHGRRVMRLLLDILQHDQDAEDAWQETWTAIWSARRRLKADRDPWPYIRLTAIRKALDRSRKEYPGRLDHEPLAQAPRDVTPLAELKCLPALERTVLVLHFWEGLSVREIAGALDVQEGSVKTWMFRGRQQLRHLLTKCKEAR
ncbi:MAG: sigma-70 family RNA polymerase sigma factor [Thermoleophilia bacterium]|nr:sigma-70 family RNA polymerase sigma factor [Thermoleophilia bacterium]